MNKTPQDKTEVLSLLLKFRTRPPIPIELDRKLVRFSKGINERGSVINIHIVRAITQALITCSSSLTCLANQILKSTFLDKLVLQRNGPIKGLADKSNITLTFAVSFTGEFLVIVTRFEPTTT